MYETDKEAAHASVYRTRTTEGKKETKRRSIKLKGIGAPPLQQVPTSSRTKGH